MQTKRLQHANGGNKRRDKSQSAAAAVFGGVVIRDGYVIGRHKLRIQNKKNYDKIP